MLRSTLTVLPIAVSGMVTLAAHGRAQETIEILEPAEWRTDATRGIGVVHRRGLRIVGIARSSAGIDRVTLNGADAALSGTA
jgi:hypothetical protein